METRTAGKVVNSSGEVRGTGGGKQFQIVEEFADEADFSKLFSIARDLKP